MQKQNYLHNYTFTAIRGLQAEREFFVTICPLDLIPRIFLYNEEQLPPDLRAQRTLNKARIPDIANYLANNQDDYVLSSITASIDGEVTFEPIKEGSSLGTLRIPLNSRIIINDGQHRRAAIERAINMNPSLAYDSISVVFYIDVGLKKSQQMFADLNKNAVRPSRSLNILYNNRSPLSKFICEMINEIEILKNRVELEKTSLSNRSSKLFTLSNIYQASYDLLDYKEKNKRITSDMKETCIKFWNVLDENIQEWQLIKSKKIHPIDLRNNYISSHGVTLQAIARVAKELKGNFPNSWFDELSKIKNIDLSRNNKIWQGRAIINSRVRKNIDNIELVKNGIKLLLKLTLTEAEIKRERDFSEESK